MNVLKFRVINFIYRQYSALYTGTIFWSAKIQISNHYTGHILHTYREPNLLILTIKYRIYSQIYVYTGYCEVNNINTIHEICYKYFGGK